ncbi:hypothetical protein BGZ95_004625 [Linnemannia exigua]|uniref:Uncharacterized protein n=1 Tax=Linnemannia exigua TaxID=604196 RepID=A0AAD4D2T0_9FUNG|nr:hypothetical protein BGZ95_004625 [Linnemannia exigua]
MEHYMSDILTAPAPAAIAEESSDTDSHEISKRELTDKLGEDRHLHGTVLSAQSNSWGERRSSGESMSRHNRHYRQHHNYHCHRESSPMASGTPIFPASRIHTASSSLSRPQIPKEVLLQGLLHRLDQQYAERDQERIRELELENEMLRRHNQNRINPDLLGYQHKDHGYALVQNHGHANLRHT